MERDNSEDLKNLEEESFVTKVRSRVSGLFNSSISKIFGNQEKRESVIRRRENDDDIYECQPPCKKAKKPLGTSDIREDSNGTLNHLYSINSLNDASTIFTNLTEPVAGPSSGNNIDIRKSFPSITTPKKVSNEKDSDSGESTSGYSSMPRICSRELVRAVVEPNKTGNQSISKISLEKEVVHSTKRLFDNMTPERPNRSLFEESRLSPLAKHKSLSSRRPSTNTSNFSSPNFIDRTVTTSRIINSPFYNGPTVYGGASAYNSQDKLSESRKQQLKHSFIVKPVNKQNGNNPCTSLSKTARKILSALEQYSAPMMDAEKIPLPTKSEKKGMLSKYVGVNPYHLKDSRVSSNRELLVPSVPELLRMKQNQRFQDTTNKIRQIATSSKTSLNNDYKICDTNQQKHTNKMKTKVSSLRKKAPTIEIIEDIVLKPITFSLPENKLPKFDLVIPPPDSLNNVYTKKEDIKACVESTVAPSQKSEVEELKTRDYINQYTFAKPLVIAANRKSVVAINNFKFSEPLSKKVSSIEKDCNKQILITKSFELKETNINNDNTSTTNLKSQSSFNSVSNEKDLMQKFRAPEGSWNCSTCLITNKKDASKCIACETLRTNSNVKNDVSLNQMVDQWECTACLIKNNNSHIKCVVCSTPKVSKSSLKSNGFDIKKRDNETSKSNGHDYFKTKSDFGDKFKPSSDTWECQTCLVRNKSNVEKCVACESKKEGTMEVKLNSQLKSSTDTWECDTCLIRNKNDIKNCAACQTPKDKVFAPLDTKSMSKTSGKWECPTCMVQNDCNIKQCVCCETAKPGVTLINKNTVNMFNFGVNKTQFNFGIPKDVSETSSLPTTTSVNTSGVVVQSKSASSDASYGNKTSDEKGKSNENVDKVAPVTSFITPKCDSESVKPALAFKFGSSNTSTKLEGDNTNSNKNLLKSPSVQSDTKVSSFVSNSITPTTKSFITNIEPKVTTVNTFTFGTPKSVITDTVKSDNAGNGNVPHALNFADAKKSSIENKFPANNESKIPFMFEKNNVEPSISFGKTEKSEPSDKPLFTFGNHAPTKGFSFNSNSEVPKFNVEEMKPKGPAAFTFDKPKQDNIFDAAIPTNAKNGGFNFGNAPMSNNQAAGFSFGSAQKQPNLGQSSSGGFNFSSPIAPVGGFNFSAPTPAFDATIKPSFNFTGGTTPTFAATPTDAAGPAGVRKFRKAIRRTAHR
ncbi:hypothetical protein WA026_020214 [Henosepilachna vigintioctopunctata]|uniref:Nuclear pore complex protein Nup153 n=1 Tax=Henosepilachna vigintioctopunctata TaxID=420089 RepID=A0AAW1UBA4_9CUCU